MGRKEQRIKNKLEKNPIKECLSIQKKFYFGKDRHKPWEWEKRTFNGRRNKETKRRVTKIKRVSRKVKRIIWFSRTCHDI